MLKLDPDLAAFNDCIAVTATFALRLKLKGKISDAHYHQVVAVLNASIYTIVFAMPPGEAAIELAEGDTIVTSKMETS